MEQDKLLTVRDVARELGITEQEVINLAEEGKIPAYKIGGVYLRFKVEQIKEAKRKTPTLIKSKDRISLSEKFADFFYFNDFYILAAVIIILMLIVILKT